MRTKSFCVFLLTGLFTASVSFAQFGDHPGQIHDDSQLVAAVKGRRNVYYVEAGNLVVTRLLPEDTSGRRHQKWQTRLTNGATVSIIYNLDMGHRIPIQVGDTFGVGGQYIQTSRQGGLVHWVHEDPKHIRPDGYVYFRGIAYGDPNPNLGNGPSGNGSQRYQY